MAINKRFLGLGFTFAATDKGLEKKLKGIRTELEGIQSALGNVSKSASKGKRSMSGLSGGSRRTKARPLADGPRKQSERTAVSREQKIAPKPVEQMGKGAFWDVGEGLKKTNTQFFKGIEDALKPFPGLSEQLYNQMDKLNLEFDKNLQLTAASKKTIAQLALSVADTTREMSKFQKIYNLFTEKLRPATQYIKGVSSEFNRFLNVLGVDLGSLVPPQLKAMGSLVKVALLDPLMSLGKNFLGIGKESGQKVGNKRLLQLKRQLVDLNAAVSGPGTDSMVPLLREIAGNTEKKEKGGIFDKLKNVFMGMFGKLGSIGGMVGKFVGPLMSSLPKLLGGLFSRAFNILPKLLGRLAGPLAALVVVGTALKGAFDGILPFISEVGENLKATGKALLDIGGKLFSDYVAAPLKNLFEKLTNFIPQGIKDVFSDLASVLTPELGEMFAGMFKDLIEVLKNPLNILDVIGKGWKNLGSVAGQAAAEASGSLKDAAQAIARPEPAKPPSRDYSAVPSRDSETKALMSRMAAAQEESNQILMRISNKDTKPVVTVAPRFNVKGANGPKIEQEEAARAGVGR